MPFGIVGRTGPGMRQVVGFGDRSTGRGTFGGEFGACHCPKGHNFFLTSNALFKQMHEGSIFGTSVT